MAHFAQLDENNVVTQVIVINNNELLTQKVATSDDGYISVSTVESEKKGIEFCQSLYGAETRWVQTSYNGSFRGKYAGVGDTYDGSAFVAPVVEAPAVEAPVVEAPVVEAPVEEPIIPQASSNDAEAPAEPQPE